MPLSLGRRNDYPQKKDLNIKYSVWTRCCFDILSEVAV